VPQIDVIDSTWIAARPAHIAELVADSANWPRWWPGLELTEHERRGAKGMRWTVNGVRGAGSADVTGTAEVWLQPMFDGVVAHFFLRLDAPPGDRLSGRRARAIERSYRRAAKRAFWALGDAVDPNRADRIAGRSGGPGRDPASFGAEAGSTLPGSL
jgi:hypothetical protein